MHVCYSILTVVALSATFFAPTAPAEPSGKKDVKKTDDKQSGKKKESEKPAFKVIEAHQTGGFAGVDIVYRITADGKYTRKSRRDKAVGKLDAKQTAALHKAVAAIDWKKLPAKLRKGGTADDFVFQVVVLIGKKAHKIDTDGISARANKQLKPLIDTLAQIQRAKR